MKAEINGIPDLSKENLAETYIMKRDPGNLQKFAFLIPCDNEGRRMADGKTIRVAISDENSRGYELINEKLPKLLRGVGATPQELDQTQLGIEDATLQATINLGASQFENEQYAEAIETYQTLIESGLLGDSSSKTIRLRLVESNANHGRSLRTAGQYKKAIPFLQTAVTSLEYQEQREDEWVLAVRALAQSQYKEKLYDDAAATSEKLIDSPRVTGLDLTHAYAYHGLSLYEAGRHKEAIPSLEIAANSLEFKEQREDWWVEAATARVCSQYKEKLYDKAAATSQTLIESGILNDLNLTHAHAYHGVSLYEGGRHKEAIPSLEIAANSLEFKAQREDWWAAAVGALYRSQYKEKLYDKAAATSQKLIEIDTRIVKGLEITDAYAYHGRSLYEGGKHKEAIPFLQTAVTSPEYQDQHKDEWVAAVGALYRSQYKEGLYDKAAATSKRLIDPPIVEGLDLTHAYAYHGLSLDKEGKHMEAIPSLGIAANSLAYKVYHEDEWVAAVGALYHSQYEEEQYDDAAATSLTLIESGVPQDLDLTDAYAYHGLSLYEGGNYKEAIPFLQTAVESPEYQDQHKDEWVAAVGALYHSQYEGKLYDKAAATSKRLIDPPIVEGLDLTHAYAYHGLSLHEAGKHKEAIPSLEMAVDSPTYQDQHEDERAIVESALARSQFEEKRYEDAAETCQRLIKSGIPKDLALTAAYVHHGLSLHKAGKHKEAIPSLEMAVDSPQYKAQRRDGWVVAANALYHSQYEEKLYDEAAATAQKLIDSGFLNSDDLAMVRANLGACRQQIEPEETEISQALQALNIESREQAAVTAPPEQSPAPSAEPSSSGVLRPTKKPKKPLKITGPIDWAKKHFGRDRDKKDKDRQGQTRTDKAVEAADSCREYTITMPGGIRFPIQRTIFSIQRRACPELLGSSKNG